MSKNICCRCQLEKLKSEAKEKNLKVTTIPDIVLKKHTRSVSIYLHPKRIKISKSSFGEFHPHNKYWRCWLMLISPNCVCFGDNIPVESRVTIENNNL